MPDLKLRRRVLGRPIKNEGRGRDCETCGTRLSRKRFGARLRLEDLSAFKRRRFCNSACANRRHLRVN